MKKKIRIVTIFVIIILMITLLYICSKDGIRSKGNIIYYDYSLAVGCHVSSIEKQYIIYDSGVIEKYYQEEGSKELVGAEKITTRELVELKNIIKKIPESFVRDRVDYETSSRFGMNYYRKRYAYNEKMEKIPLGDIEAEELEKLEKYAEELIKKYEKKIRDNK